MATVFDVAKYILEKRGRTSTMKLQKLCYYSQAWSLVWDDEPLFEEDFEAWANGPVCPALFYATQGRFSIEAQDEPGDSNNLTDTQRETIDAVLNHYGAKNAQELSDLSHYEDPWKNARGNTPFGVPSHAIISKESMGMYYGSL